ncbi:MAG: MerR family transcriptional regulator [Proteobacteria bacterium]|nr:MerR family transcriptional regulator [Pseudomonadota bacterium]
MTIMTYSIGEMCAEFSVTPRTLRFYEYKELLAPLRDGQRRLFTQRDRARLRLILRGKRFGFSLDELKDLLDLYDTDRTQVTQLSATLEAARRHHAALTAKRDELTLALVDLETQMGLVRRMIDERSSANAA